MLVLDEVVCHGDSRKMNRRLGEAMRCDEGPGLSIATAGMMANHLRREILVSVGE